MAAYKGCCRVIRHLAFEDLGLLGPLIEARELELRLVEAGIDDVSALDPTVDDLWVILGGPIGVYETDDYPFLHAETAAIARRLAAKRPTLGICLGAQLMAQALGASVHGNPKGKEIGWAPLTLTTVGVQSSLGAVGDLPVLHWHGDIFDLAPGAELLAATSITPHQAFALGDYGLGLQFHIEVRASDIERWLIGHRAELGQAGIDIPALRAKTQEIAPQLAPKAEAALNLWLDRALK